MAKLTVTKGPAEEEVYPIGEGVTLGREGHNSIPMPNNRGCSRDHAKIWRTGPGKYSVADLGSTNGTMVNDEKTGRSELEDGDVVQICQIVFRFDLDLDEKPKPKVKPADSGREDFAAILRGEKQRDERPVATELQGQAAIQMKQRLLQYNKKKNTNSAAGWDLSQMGAGTRWAFYVLALAAAGGLFFVVSKVIGG